MRKFDILFELCKLAEIKTFEDLKCFQKEYSIIMATPTALIRALSDEVKTRIEEGFYEQHI